MSALLELAERCEQATGPDRELDRSILWAVHSPRHKISPHYTAALDCAMALVGDNDFFIKRVPNNPRPCRACVWIADRNVGFDGDADTPVLALCAAALRARSPESAR